MKKQGFLLWSTTQRKNVSVQHFVLRVPTKTQSASKTFFPFQCPLLPPVDWPSLLHHCCNFHVSIISAAHTHQRLSEHPLDSFTCTLSDSLREHTWSLVHLDFPSEKSYPIPPPHTSHVCLGSSGDAIAQIVYLLCISMGFNSCICFL